MAIERWRCDQCKEVHDNQEDAMECCCEITAGYGCPVCGDFFTAPSEAEACCADHDAPRIPTTAELEALGQERLFA